MTVLEIKKDLLRFFYGLNTRYNGYVRKMIIFLRTCKEKFGKVSVNSCLFYGPDLKIYNSNRNVFLKGNIYKSQSVKNKRYNYGAQRYYYNRYR